MPDRGRHLWGVGGGGGVKGVNERNISKLELRDLMTDGM